MLSPKNLMKNWKIEVLSDVLIVEFLFRFLLTFFFFHFFGQDFIAILLRSKTQALHSSPLPVLFYWDNSGFFFFFRGLMLCHFRQIMYQYSMHALLAGHLWNKFFIAAFLHANFKLLRGLHIRFPLPFNRCFLSKMISFFLHKNILLTKQSQASIKIPILQYYQ